MAPNNHYHHLVFGTGAFERQRECGSYVAYGVNCERPDDGPDQLTSREKQMISGATQFHIASNTPARWPYIQYRSGPRGFLHVIDDSTIGFADFRGNNQYVTVGNLDTDNRVALFIIDYQRRSRLKLFGRAAALLPDDDSGLFDTLRQVDSGVVESPCERSIVISVEAFDWNCSRSIAPLYDKDYLSDLGAVYQRKISDLEAEVAALKDELRRISRN